MDSSVVLGTAPLVSGQATLVTTSLSVGTHPIQVTYPRDTNYANRTSKVLNQVVKP